MKQKNDKSSKKLQKDNKFRIEYIIPNDLKDMYVNGVYGGIFSENGDIQLHFFSERPSVPKLVNYDVDIENQKIIAESEELDFDSNFVRVIQSSLIMNFSTAVKIRDWLDDKINEINKTKG